MSGDLTFNKIAAAVLATALGFMLIKEVSHSAMHVEYPDKPAYGANLVVDTGAEDGPVLDLPFPQETWVASMDAEKGAKVFKKCTSCHNVEDGGKNGTGPNLWDIVGKPAAAHDGFAYSGALTNAEVTWDYASLDQFLTKPANFVSGTKMAFVGLKKEADRAAVIEYLRLKSAAPAAQPEAAATPVDTSVAIEGIVDASGAVVDGGQEATVVVIEDIGQAQGKAVEGVKDKTSEIVKDLKDEVKKVVEPSESEEH